MDILKAILNLILLFFDDVGERIKRLSGKGRRRLLLLAAVFLMLVILLMILCVSSCRSTGEAATADAVRTRVRGTIDHSQTEGPRVEGEVTLSSDVHPVTSPSGPEVTWPPEPDPTDEPIQPTIEPTAAEPTPAPADTDAPPDDTPEPEATPKYATLKKHDKSEAVTTLQYRLMELGYLDIDEPTNYFGSSTESALILFQRQHDLKQDGIAGSETQTILYGETAERYCLKEGAEGQDVKALQEQLVELGYLSEKEVDRVYGPVTIAAVEAFQKRNNLHVDGLAGEKTLELLYSDSAKISKELQKQQEAEAAAKKKVEEEAAKKKAEEEAAKSKPTPTKKGTSSTSSSSKKKTPTPKPKPTPTPTPKRDLRIDKFIAAANSKIGCEYVLGAKGPNKFDCTGLVYYCLREAGVEGTRLNAAGYSQKSSWKKIESINSLKKGDILFFRSDTNSSVNHTGIYVGGDTMIDASSGNGKVVKRALSAYWKRNFVCARRPWRE